MSTVQSCPGSHLLGPFVSGGRLQGRLWANDKILELNDKILGLNGNILGLNRNFWG